MQILYKTLFEVHLLHEFYLTKQDGTSIFASATQADRTTFLLDFFSLGRRSINSDVGYSIPDAAVTFFQNHKLKLVPTYSGFKIATAVNTTTDGALIAFQPVVPLAKDAAITVFINRINSAIDSFSCTRMKNTIKKIFYLSNENVVGNKTFPFLTNPVPAKDNSYTYEQGELSLDAGAVKSFYIDSANAGQFLPVTAGTNFLNESDRLVVSSFFTYYFEATDNVKQAKFSVKDSTNTEVYKNTFSSDTNLVSASVRIDPELLKKLPDGKSLSDLLCTMTVTGDGGYNKTFQLIFLDAPPEDQPWAVVNINPQPSSAAFNIIDNNGLLITRLNADGSVAQAVPSFEVWIKSKFSFWRYLNNDGKLLKNLFPAILEQSGNNLVTQKPVNQSYLPIPLSAQRLPNPGADSLVRKEGSRQFADIIVPISDTFPMGP